jgi:hypothetical protein
VTASEYDGLSSLVFVAGVYEGVVPVVVRLLVSDDARPLLVFPLRLAAPWWWITSVVVILVAIGLLERIDQAKRRAVSGEGRLPR